MPPADISVLNLDSSFVYSHHYVATGTAHIINPKN